MGAAKIKEFQFHSFRATVTKGTININITFKFYKVMFYRMFCVSPNNKHVLSVVICCMCRCVA